MASKIVSQKVYPDAALASIIGAAALKRSDIIKKLWVLFKKRKLNCGRIIRLDSNLRASHIWGNKTSIDMTEVGKALKHTR